MKSFAFVALLLCLVVAAQADRPRSQRPAPLQHNLGSGFNVFTGEHKPAAIKLSNNNRKTWFNPHLQRAESVPDNVQVWVNAEVYEGVSVQASLAAYADFKATESGAADWVPHSSFQGEAVGRAEWMFAGGERVCAVAYETIALYAAVIGNGNVTLQDELVSMLPAATATADSDDDSKVDLSPYHQIISQYGTHVVFSGQFGGQLEFLASFAAGAYFEGGAVGVAQASASKFRKYRSASGSLSGEVAEQGAVEADFAFSLSAKGGLYESYSKTNDNNNNNSEGQSAKIEDSATAGHAKWAESVKSAPANIKTTQLRPIHEFFAEPQHQKHMKMALRQHANKQAKPAKPSMNLEWLDNVM